MNLPAMPLQKYKLIIARRSFQNLLKLVQALGRAGNDGDFHGYSDQGVLPVDALLMFTRLGVVVLTALASKLF